MRKEPFTVGNYVHVLNRGVRKQPITRDISDQWRFLKLLCHLNDTYRNFNWEREIDAKHPLIRPSHWPEKEPLVEILSFCLMPNHFHLMLKEIREDGVSMFMKRLGNSMNAHFNGKYDESGSIFQGSYRSKTILDDSYLRYLAVYVMVKNPFELLPGGINGSMKHFDIAFEQVASNPFCSLGDYVLNRNSSIITKKEILGEIFEESSDFKKFACEVMEGRGTGAISETEITLAGFE